MVQVSVDEFRENHTFVWTTDSTKDLPMATITFDSEENHAYSPEEESLKHLKSLRLEIDDYLEDDLMIGDEAIAKNE